MIIIIILIIILIFLLNVNAEHFEESSEAPNSSLIEEIFLSLEPPTTEPVVETPISSEPVVETPIEQPVTEEPVIEEPVTEEPVTEEPVVEVPIEQVSQEQIQIFTSSNPPIDIRNLELECENKMLNRIKENDEKCEGKINLEKTEYTKLKNEYDNYKTSMDKDINDLKKLDTENIIKYNKLNTDYNNLKVEQKTLCDTTIDSIVKEWENRLQKELDNEKNTCVVNTIKLETKHAEDLSKVQDECKNERKLITTTYINEMKKSTFYSYQPGLKFNIYDGYINGNVAHGSIAKLTNRFGSVPYGFSESMNNISSATNNIIPKYSSDISGGGFTVEWTGLIYNGISTGDWSFTITTDETVYIWIGDFAIANYSKNNPLLYIKKDDTTKTTIEDTGTIKLSENRFYPIRILYSSKNGKNPVMNLSMAIKSNVINTNVFYSYK